MSIGKSALVLAGSFALLSTGASAAVVCNDEGDCWRVKEKYEYRPEFKLHVYDDDWKWGDADAHRGIVGVKAADAATGAGASGLNSSG